jgi:hypothetical protein
VELSFRKGPRSKGRKETENDHQITDLMEIVISAPENAGAASTTPRYFDSKVQQAMR